MDVVLRVIMSRSAHDISGLIPENGCPPEDSTLFSRVGNASSPTAFAGDGKCEASYRRRSLAVPLTLAEVLFNPVV